MLIEGLKDYQISLDSNEILDCLIYEKQYKLQDNTYSPERMIFFVKKLGLDNVLGILSYSYKVNTELFNILLSTKFKINVKACGIAREELGDLYTKDLITNKMRKIQKLLEIVWLRNNKPYYEYEDLYLIRSDKFYVEIDEKEIKDVIKTMNKNKKFNIEMRNFIYNINFHKGVKQKITPKILYDACKDYQFNYKIESVEAKNIIKKFIKNVIKTYESTNNGKTRSDRFNMVMCNMKQYIRLRDIITPEDYKKDKIRRYENTRLYLNSIYGYEKYKKMTP
jgi:hypothetical protein